MSLFNKCRNFTTAREVQAAGYYPFFREISSAPDTEVVVEGILRGLQHTITKNIGDATAHFSLRIPISTTDPDTGVGVFDLSLPAHLQTGD